MTSSVYPDCPVIAVGAVVIKDGKVLLVKRGKAPSKGLWAIPGGRVELGETLQQAAEREILEETGLTIKAKEPVFVFDMVAKDEKGMVKYHYVIVDLKAELISGELKPGDDAEDAKWFFPSELDDLDLSEKTSRFLQSIIRPSPDNTFSDPGHRYIFQY